jgi:hypothetical protein
MSTEKPYVEADTDDHVPRQAWPRLVHYLNRFALTKHQYEKSDEEAAYDLLQQGEKIQIPRSIRRNGEEVPYAIWPTQACEIIKACVDFIYWKADKTPVPSTADLQSIKGAMFLAEQLFHHAVCTPNGQFHLHRLNKEKEIVPYAHTQKIKRLAGQLTKYRETLLALLSTLKIPSSIPTLSCRTVVEEEIKSSKKKFEIMLSQGFEGDLQDATDSLDALKDNKGFQATKSVFENPEGDTEQTYSEETELNIPEGNPNDVDAPTLLSSPTLAWDNPLLLPSASPRETQRGNITSHPSNWIWTYEQDPLEYTLEYACHHASEAITQAIELLQTQKNNPDTIDKIGTKALIINPKNKVNPDGFWRYLRSLTSGLAPEESEHASTLEKLDCARFSLALEKLNSEWGRLSQSNTIQQQLFNFITPPENPERIRLEEFSALLTKHPWAKTWADCKTHPETQRLLSIAFQQGEAYQNLLHQKLVELKLVPHAPEFPVDHPSFMATFYSKTSELLQQPLHTHKLRNEILLETFLQTPKADGSMWSQKEAEIWLEHLQTQAVGTYENSPATEDRRKKLLGLLNSVYSAAEADPNNETRIMKKLAESLYSKLSGATSQIARRELRNQLNELKKSAESRGDQSKTTSLQKMISFVSSISSQIKSQAWYENKHENTSRLEELLTCVLHEPKTHTLFFPGSKKPEPKEPLPITLDFLKNYSEEKDMPIGNHTINTEIEQARLNPQLQEGQKIQKALEQVSKTLDLSQGAERPLLQKKKVLESALSITKTLHNSKHPLETMDELCSNALEIVKYASQPDHTFPPSESQQIEPWEIDTIVENLEHTQNQLCEANRTHKQNPRLFSEANYQLQLSLHLLPHAQFQNEKQQKKFLQKIQQLEKEITITWENNYLFWKGLSTIAWNIKTRRESTEFQAELGTLKNILSITKAKSENTTAGLCTKQETPTQSRIFQITHSRARKIPWEITIPIALWLSKETKGGKTKISKKDFENLLESRIQSCQLLIDLAREDKNLGRTFHQFQGSKNEQQRLVNERVLHHCLLFVQEPEELKKGIRWTQKNRELARSLRVESPHLDTPQKLTAQRPPPNTSPNTCSSRLPQEMPTNRRSGRPKTKNDRALELQLEDDELSQEIPL